MSRKPGQELTAAQLECLNSHSKDTLEYDREAMAIETLHRLCREFGYVKVRELANNIYTIWDEPKARVFFERLRDRKLQLITEEESNNVCDNSN